MEIITITITITNNNNNNNNNGSHQVTYSKINVFKAILKEATVVQDLTLTGSLFHCIGAAWLKLLSPYVISLVTGMLSRRGSEDEQKALCGWYGSSRTFRYAGPASFNALKVSKSSLNKIRR